MRDVMSTNRMSNVNNYSEKLVQDIARAINGVQIPADDRPKIVGALFDIVHEHHQAVVILVRHRLYGAASALMRSIFESYVRGLWFPSSPSKVDT